MVSTHAFSEKVALIADGTSPVGKAVALQLALCGAYVIVAHPAGDKELPVIEELKSLGTLAASAPYSKYGRTGATEIAAKVGELYGRLDLLVNCPSSDVCDDFRNTSEDQFSKTMEKVVQSVFFNSKECLKLMEDRPKPKIVNIFSACDSEGSKKDLALVTANAALEAFSNSLSGLLPNHFRVNGICVSEIGSGSNESADLDPDLFRTRDGVDPDDVARAVLFLMSSEAAGLKGQVLKITG